MKLSKSLWASTLKIWLFMLIQLWCWQCFAPPGYHNLIEPPGYSFHVRQLTHATNTVDTLFATATNLTGFTVYKLNPNGFEANNYLTGWTDSNMPVVLGEAWFLKNPHPTNVVLTCVGDTIGVPFQYSNNLPSGISASGFLLFTADTLTNQSFPGVNGDQVFMLTNGSSSYSAFTYNDGWAPGEPTLELMQAMWIQRASSAVWVKTNTSDPVYSSYSAPQITGTTGQLNFFTFNATNSSLGRVFQSDAVTPLSTNYLGQLYAGTNSNESLFVPIGTPVNFIGGSTAGYVRSGAPFVPFATGGQAVWVQLRAWNLTNGGSYEAALTNGGFVGKSAVMNLTARATIESGLPGLPPPDVNLFPSFSLNIHTSLIAQWNFNSVVPDANVGTGSSAASYGSGTAAPTTPFSFNTGDSVADPAGVVDNSAWTASTFPPPTQQNKTAGVRFSVSMQGWDNIRISWRQRASNNASKYARLQYSTNGLAFFDAPTATVMTNGNVFESKTNDLSGVSMINNSTGFVFRIVTEFESTATGSGSSAYVGVSGGYNSGSQLYFDMVSVHGESNQPAEPSSTNANLSALTTTAGVMTPAFDSAGVSYSATVGNSTTSVTVTPTKEQGNAIIEVRINGGGFSPVASGFASGALPLNVGSNTVEVRVTAEDIITTKTYVVTVFRQVPPPSATTVAATAIGSVTATLNGTVNPSNSPTLAWFQWGTTTNYGNTTATTNIGNGSVNVAVASSLVSLIPGTLYHYRITATNDGGIVFGTNQSFTILSTNANLAGLGTPAGTLTPAFSPSVVNYSVSVPNNTSSVTVMAVRQQANATLQIRINGGSYAFMISGSPSSPLPLVIGTNSIEVLVTAQDSAFARTYSISVVRPAVAPAVVTWAASNVTSTNATLRGSVNPNSSGALAWFEWGTNTSYGNTTAAANVGSGDAVVAVTAPITGLNAALDYHFRIVASNVAGISFGADQPVSDLFAYDDAAPYVNWNTGTNHGFGFGPWTLQQTPTGGGNYAGFFVDVTAGPVASTNGKSWGLYANGVSGNNAAVAYRAFNSPLVPDTRFKIKWHNKGIGFGPNQEAGFCLRSGNASNSTDDFATNLVFRFYYVGGGQDQFFVQDSPIPIELPISFADNPLEIEFILRSNANYQLVIRNAASGNFLHHRSGNINPGTSIDSVAFYTRQTDGDQLFNEMEISSASLVPPAITGLYPQDGVSFVPANNGLSFIVEAPVTPVPTNNITLMLNGITQTNLTFDTNASARTVTLNSLLPDNVVINGVITATDAAGNQTIKTFSFNTWRADNPFIEAEDYNFGGGNWFTNQQAFGLYSFVIGVNGIDYLELGDAITNDYRIGDLPQIELGETPRPGAPPPDYTVAYIKHGEWMNYTRRLSNTTYTVIARMAGFGANPVMQFEHLSTPTATTSNQSLAALGTFVYPSDTGGFQNYAFVPLTDFFSQPVRIRFPGTNTFRCTSVGTGDSYNFTYLTFIPSTDTNIVRPYLSAGFPFPSAQTTVPDPLISFTIANAETAVMPASIQFFINNSNVTAGCVLINNAAGTAVSYQPLGLISLNSTNTLAVIFSDGTASQTNQWQFSVTDAPKILSPSATFGSVDPVSGTAPVTFSAMVHPGRLDTSVAFQFGLTTNYGGTSPPLYLGPGANWTAVNSINYGFVPTKTYHYRVVATNASGITLGADQILVGAGGIPGDTDLNGIVDEAELNVVLANYWPYSPWLYLTNVAGLGGTNVSFALTNNTAGAFSVEFSTNLADWQFLGPATPRYEFTDTNAPAAPQRSYRLRWP